MTKSFCYGDFNYFIIFAHSRMTGLSHVRVAVRVKNRTQYNRPDVVIRVGPGLFLEKVL